MALGDALNAAMSLPSIVNLPSSVQVLESFDAELMAELRLGFRDGADSRSAQHLRCAGPSPFPRLPAADHDSVGDSALGGRRRRRSASGSRRAGSACDDRARHADGHVTKNSILLVDYAVLAMRERGLALQEALLDACHKRARPIVMTTAAMVAGMLPIALGLGADARLAADGRCGDRRATHFHGAQFAGGAGGDFGMSTAFERHSGRRAG